MILISGGLMSHVMIFSSYRRELFSILVIFYSFCLQFLGSALYSTVIGLGLGLGVLSCYVGTVNLL